MTKQAMNSINLYKGSDPETIKQLLRYQKPSVVEELKEHFGVQEISALAVRLAFA